MKLDLKQRNVVRAFLRSIDNQPPATRHGRQHRTRPR